MRRTSIWLAFLIVGLAGCHHGISPGGRGPGVALTANSLRHEPDLWFRSFEGDGFTFLYPRSGQLSPGTSFPNDIPGSLIVGADLDVVLMTPPTPESTGRMGPLFQLLVGSFPNPGRRSLDAIADSVVKRYNAYYTDESLGGPATSSFETIAGQRVAVVSPDCGDCRPTEVYFVRPDRIVVFAWSSSDTDLLDPVTGPLYWFIVSTFRWK